MAVKISISPRAIQIIKRNFMFFSLFIFRREHKSVGKIEQDSLIPIFEALAGRFSSV
ncbi:MAG: hypothetical protein H6Q38_3286 [Chloroflexi bacterium]|nr:hypothetical protein [Chloroflexota bacterium]